jgi:hypothetical protein
MSTKAAMWPPISLRFNSLLRITTCEPSIVSASLLTASLSVARKMTGDNCESKRYNISSSEDASQNREPGDTWARKLEHLVFVVVAAAAAHSQSLCRK